MTCPYHFDTCSAVDAIGRAHVTTSTPRTRRSSTEIDSAIRPSDDDERHLPRRRVARRAAGRSRRRPASRLAPSEIHDSGVLPVIAQQRAVDRGGEEDDAGVEDADVAALFESDDSASIVNVGEQRPAAARRR